MKRCKKIKYYRGRARRLIFKVPKPVDTNSLSTFEEWNQGEGGFHDTYQRHIYTPKTSLQHVKDWLATQRFIPQNLNDDFLDMFLSAADYNSTRATDLIQRYFYSRQEPSFLFQDRDPLSPENVELFKNLYVTPMPGKSQDGLKVIITGIIQPAYNYHQLAHIKYLAMVIDFLIWNEDFGDFAIIFEGTGFRIPQLWESKVRNPKFISSLLLDTIPGTLCSFYFLFPPPHVTHTADSRHGIWITVVRSKNEMAKLLPGALLPLEFGGELGRLQNIIERWNRTLADNQEFFVTFEKKMANDYRRRLCYEKERREGGRNWVQKMKLEADEWEYKIQYYKKMKNFQPIKHRGFGKERIKPKGPVKAKDPMEACRRIAKLEADRGLELFSTKIYDNFIQKSDRAVEKAKEEAEAEARAKAEAELERRTMAKVLLQQNSVPLLEVRFLNE